MRKAMYNATLADLDIGERIQVIRSCGHQALLIVTYLVEKRKLPMETRVLDLANKVRCRGCGKRGSSKRVEVSVVKPK
jgi:hypothetical protein